MSKAFMCDRCRTCFNPLDVKHDQYFMTIKEVFTQNGCEYLGNEVEYRIPEAMHLCPSCSELIIKIMHTNPDVCCSCGKHKEEEIYNEGFEAGVAACNRLGDILGAVGLASNLFGKGRGNSSESNGNDSTTKRKGCTKKDSEH